MRIYVFTYGTVKIEIYSHNKKVNTSYTVVISTYHILLKYAKTREPEDKCCVLQCTYTSNNICDPIPLDKLKNHTALPYITQNSDNFSCRNKDSHALISYIKIPLSPTPYA